MDHSNEQGPAASARAWARRAREQLMVGLVQPAEACSKRALELAPDDPESLLVSGLVAERRRRTGDAITAYRAALEAGASGALAWARLGSALSEIGEDEPAVKALEAALRADADDPMIWNDLGNAHLALGRLRSAELSYQEAIARFENCAFAHCGLAHVARLRGDKRAAVQWSHRATALDPEDQKAILLSAWMVNLSGREQDAAALLERASSHAFDPSERWLAAQILEAAGQNHASRHQLGLILESRPISADDWSARSCATGRLVAVDHALAVCAEGLLEHPNAIELRATQVGLLADAGQAEAAIAGARSLARELPRHPDLVESILQALLEVYLFDEARSFLKAALAIPQWDARLCERLRQCYPLASTDAP